MNWGRAKEQSGHGEMNFKRKHPSYKKYRYLRRGWRGEGKDQIIRQVNKDSIDKIIEFKESRE